MAPPPRQGYGGPEEASEVRRRRMLTHPSLPLDQRVMVAEERAAGAEEVAIALGKEFREEIAGLRDDHKTLVRLIGELKETNTKITRSLDGPEGQLEQGLVWKVSHLHSRSRKSDGVIWGVLMAGAIGLGAWLLQLFAKTHGG